MPSVQREFQVPGCMTVHGSPAPARCRCKRTNAVGPRTTSRHTNQIDVRVTAVSNKRHSLPVIQDVQHVQGYGFCHGLSRRRDGPRRNAVLWGSRVQKGRPGVIISSFNDSPSCW